MITQRETPQEANQAGQDYGDPLEGSGFEIETPEPAYTNELLDMNTEVPHADR
jgi:hypothetical protein